ncbi:MAG: flavodoxin-dependent (E)-4-hydroxy-3-methylbut-2-enyl-diphosphate synthase, partial [Actinobacteria bacterium]
MGWRAVRRCERLVRRPPARRLGERQEEDDDPARVVDVGRLERQPVAHVRRVTAEAQAALGDGARRRRESEHRYERGHARHRLDDTAAGYPPVVQSMTLTKTHDVEATTAQIAALASAGCEIVRVAVPKTEDADALPRIVRFSPIPVIADIHFNASLALRAIDAGVAAVRINPGNIGGDDKVASVVHAAKARGIPMRIGANSGSLPKHLA